MEGNGHNTENENLKQKRGKETRGLKKPMKFLEKMIVKFKQGNSLRQSDVAKKSNAARSKTEYDHEMINTQKWQHYLNKQKGISLYMYAEILLWRKAWLLET